MVAAYVGTRILHVMETALVVCIGNRARGDDGVARRVAELLEGRLPDGVRVHSAPQLDVVLADDVADVDLVVFADAHRRDRPAVVVCELSPGTTGTTAHSLDPAGLLALSAALRGRSPRAVLVSIAAPEMEHDESLSPTAVAASEEAATVILELLG